MVLGNRTPVRQVESEGILRLFLLALALAMPLATLVYLKIQSTHLSYQMSEIKDHMRKEEEFQRTLLLERSRWQRDEEVEAYAHRSGLQPRKQGRLIRRSFTAEDQRLAKLRPVSSDEMLR